MLSYWELLESRRCTLALLGSRDGFGGGSSRGSSEDMLNSELILLVGELFDGIVKLVVKDDRPLSASDS